MEVICKKSKLNIRFHNPNIPEVAAEYIIKVFVDTHEKTVEKILQQESLELFHKEKKECIS